MKEIDLTKTPLSEIDLTRIDYEKSYLIFKGGKYLIIENTLKQSPFEHNYVLYALDSKPWRGFLFYPNGKHYYNEATLHLFYKETNNHPIVIEYVNLGDTVKIVKIEGVMTYGELEKHTSKSVLKEYCNNAPSMAKQGKEVVIVCGDPKVGNRYARILTIGEEKDKTTFLDAVENMKLASKRLASLIKESKQPKIERIEI